jgi:hypothetical protein
MLQPLRLGVADGGTRDAPVIWRAAEDGEVLITGTQELRLSWEQWRDGIQFARIDCEAIDQLFVDGQRQHMARYPD